MKLKERLSYFWNVTLGEDIPENIEIEDSQDPSLKELQESLKKIKELEKGYKVDTTTSTKSGKSKKAEVVQTVVIDPKVVTKAAEMKKQKVEKEKSTEKELGE